MMRSRPRAAGVLNGLAVLFLAGGVASGFMMPAQAAPSGGSNWGPAGSAGPTSSAVTVAWDNSASGQPSSDQVPRDSSQVLPYTGGAAYNPDSAVSKAVKQEFGGMTLRADQTTGLGHQAVSLSYTGVQTVPGGEPGLDVFQCWGGGTAVDGVTADAPDPTHCETVNDSIADSDSALIAKGDLPSPLTVTVSGFEDPGATSIHLWAQIAGAGLANRTLSPSAGTVQFTAGDTKLGAPVPVKGGIAATQVTGLAKGAVTQVTATYTPAPGQNYAPAVPSAPLSFPEAFQQGTGSFIGDLVDIATTNQTLFSGSRVQATALAGSFKPGDKVHVTLNLPGPRHVVRLGGNIISLPTAGAQVASVATVSTAPDGSATGQFTVPSALPASPSYALVFSDQTHSAPQVVDTADIQPFPAPQRSASAGSNEPPANQTSLVPFHDIQGHPQFDQVSDFSSASSNELDFWQAPGAASGTTTRQFTVSTTQQDANLGCGTEAGSAQTTATCWLVAIPVDRGSIGLLASNNDLSPSAWAQRLQVKLTFAPINGACTASLPIVSGEGSELLGNAMSSWGPAICAADGVNISYASQQDSVARQQYASGATSLLFTTQPVNDAAGGTKTLYAPVGLSAVTIGLHLTGADGAQRTTVKLNARLVAKLLTQSYIAGIDPGAPGTELLTGQFDIAPYRAVSKGLLGPQAFAPWASTAMFPDLFADPEFQALNPNFTFTPQTNSVFNPDFLFDNLGSLVVSSTASDPIATLWQWLLSDPHSRSFLDGCPDTAAPLDGHATVVNPFFSTGTYAQCPAAKTALAKTAQADIDQTVTQFHKYAAAAAPDLKQVLPVPQAYNYTYTPVPVTYSAVHPTFPLPAWYEVPTNGIGVSFFLDNTSANMHSQENSLANVEADVASGAPPWLANWCQVAGGNCAAVVAQGTDGVWTKESASVFNPVLGITSAPAAAQFQTATAQLCDDQGNCQGADAQSLEAAAAHFATTSTPGVLAPSMTPREKDGAYPLTVPVYAAVNENSLTSVNATGSADLLKFVSGPGNQPGLTTGSLPVGYAPLPGAMVAQDAAAVRTLQQIAKTAPPGPPPHRQPPTPAAAPPGDGTPPPGGPPPAPPPPPARPGQPGTPPAATRPARPTSPPATQRVPAAPVAFRSSTPATPVGLAEYGLIIGVVLAAVSAAGALLAGRRRPLTLPAGLDAAGLAGRAGKAIGKAAGGLRGRKGSGA
jgi:hypothetical protein